MTRLQAFSWGYWGWGNHTSDFVSAVDAIERDRGKRPPIFADMRKHRLGRAPGFHGTAFEETVGKKRYRWLRKLGNDRIGSGRPGVKLIDKTGIDDLLQLIRDADKERRRVIFFCGCASPSRCHRARVRKLLVSSAARQGVPLSVVEWPGGEPKTATLRVSEGVLSNVLRGGTRVVFDGLSFEELRGLAALPWGSRVRLCSNARDIAIISGPAQMAKHWYLPVLGPETRKETDTIESLSKEAARLREKWGYAYLRSG